MNEISIYVKSRGMTSLILLALVGYLLALVLVIVVVIVVVVPVVGKESRSS